MENTKDTPNDKSDKAACSALPRIAGKLAIPGITDERLSCIAARIKPTYLCKGQLMWMEIPDLRKVAFTWSPEPKSKAKGLVEIAKIMTLHTYGHHGFFKPSIAEVIAQIPEDLIDKAAGFRTTGPDDVDELNANREALNAGFHVGQTTLYGQNGNS